MSVPLPMVPLPLIPLPLLMLVAHVMMLMLMIMLSCLLMLVELKAEWRLQKTSMFTEIDKDRQAHKVGHKTLKWEHFIMCFKPAWYKAFAMERNLKG